MFPDLRKLPYEQRLSHLRLWILEERRNRADLIEVYKMIKGILATPWLFFFSRVEAKTTRGHMKHILRLVSYCKNTITSAQPTFLPFDISVSVRDHHQKKFVQFFFRFLPR